MAARTHSADPRAARVRTLLHEAAFALVHEHPVDALTVASIVERAGVSRQVFYQHFGDRDDAVAAAFTVAFARATADIGTDPRARISRLFDFAGEHRDMYRNVIPSAVAQRVVDAFRTELSPACAEIADTGLAVVAPVSGLTAEGLTRFLVGGFTEVLRSWMEDPTGRDLRDRVDAAFGTIDALLMRSGRL